MMDVAGFLEEVGRMKHSKMLREIYNKTLEQEPVCLQYQHLLSAAFVLFMATTSLYTGLLYSIPECMGEVLSYHPSAIFWWQVFITVGFLQIVSNFLCIRLYPSYYQPSQLQLETRSKGQTQEDCSSGGEALPWRYCPVCQHDSPPRSHHCKVCKRCTLKRDHHCFIVGSCIGYYNQRFFVVFCAYLGVFSFFCLYISTHYLSQQFYHTSTWTDYLLPITFLKFMCGYLDLHVFLMIVQWYVFPWVCPMCVSFTFIQFVCILTGKTIHECLKTDSSIVTTSVRNNFHSVFGDFWVLHFIFPVGVWFRLDGDGTQWPGVYRNRVKHDQISLKIDASQKMCPKNI